MTHHDAAQLYFVLKKTLEELNHDPRAADPVFIEACLTIIQNVEAAYFQRKPELITTIATWN